MMNNALVQNNLKYLSKDMYNYLSCKDIDRFYMMINMTATKMKETTSNVYARGIKLKLHYNYPDCEYDMVKIDYINNNSGLAIKTECFMADLKKYVGKAYKASAYRFFG